MGSAENVPGGNSDALRQGCRVVWPATKQGGALDRIEGNQAHVIFDNGEDHTFKITSEAITRDPFTIGDHVMRSDGTLGVVVAEVEGQDYPTWAVSWANGTSSNAVEMTLRRAVTRDPVARLKAGEIGSAEAFNLKSVAADTWYRHLHDDLVSLGSARVDLKPHQVSVVHRVISDYPHRYLLCDEVGLGKTIEAAMIVKELRARGQAKRVLILVPSGLARQWQFELKTKFNETFAVFNRATLDYLRNKDPENPWLDHDSVIVSHSWASRTEERREEIAAVPWDLIIVDEAHHARRQRQGNRTQETNLYRLVAALTSKPEFARRAVLLLTATPLQLHNHELFSLLEIVNPVLFASEASFVRHLEELAGLNQLVERLESGGLPPDSEKAEFTSAVARFLAVDSAEVDVLLTDVPTLIDRLRGRHRLSEVLVRNRRSIVGGFMPRKAYRWEVELTQEERDVQDLMDLIIAEGFEQAEVTRRNAIGFLMTTWQRLAVSSSRALLASLRNRRNRLAEGMISQDLSEQDAEQELEDDTPAAEVAGRVVAAVTNDEVEHLEVAMDLLQQISVDSKARVFIDRLRELFAEDRDAKVLVFTEFRETQDMLAELVREAGWGSNVFHGQLALLAKDAAVERFRTKRGAQVLISTEAGGEGRNFQFAHIVVNYDLPWNPMKVEQRIGRIDRIGQEHAVSVFNFHVHGTIESRILDVLENRIKIFEDSVGGLDPILGETEADIRRALRETAAARDAALDELGKALEERVDSARQATEQLGDFILDTRSYSSGIAQTLQQQDPVISQRDWEAFLRHLLASVNTWVGEPDTSEEREIHFHPPFTEDHRELIGNLERRRVCFDPRVSVDSEHVEYLGFGHPIVDALVRGVMDESVDGIAAGRAVSSRVLPQIRPGWQFVWLLTVGGVRTEEQVHSVFVDDAGHADRTVGRKLLELSRKFLNEEPRHALDTSGLDAAMRAAEATITQTRDRLIAKKRRVAEERYEVELSRIELLYEHRTQSAEDRILACEQTLGRLEASSDPLQRQAIPLWEANAKRARAESDQIAQDRTRALHDLATHRNPEADYRLLCAARIEVLN